MKNAIIIHGKPDKEEYYSDKYPSSSNFQWIPWLQKQLIMRDIEAVTPEMFHAYNPDYKIWKREFERFNVTPETILVGHSCGGGFLIRWLSENKEVKAGKVILVAPWLDPDRELDTGFFDFDIDTDLAARTKELIVFISDDDFDSIQKSVEKIKSEMKDIKLREFHGYGHFIVQHMKKEEFPELLEECLK